MPVSIIALLLGYVTTGFIYLPAHLLMVAIIITAITTVLIKWVKCVPIYL